MFSLEATEPGLALGSPDVTTMTQAWVNHPRRTRTRGRVRKLEKGPQLLSAGRVARGLLWSPRSPVPSPLQGVSSGATSCTTYIPLLQQGRKREDTSLKNKLTKKKKKQANYVKSPLRGPCWEEPWALRATSGRLSSDAGAPPSPQCHEIRVERPGGDGGLCCVNWRSVRPSASGPGNTLGPQVCSHILTSTIVTEQTKHHH